MDDFIPSIAYSGEISRSQKWYHINKKYFCGTWTKKYAKWVSFDYDNDLLYLQSKVNRHLNNVQLNSCLINRYDSGKFYIGAHRDNSTTFGEYPTIANISLGSSRDIVFKRKGKEEIRFTLESGSLFIMSGSSQKYYTHEVPCSDTEDVRFSLTFRETI